MLLACIAFAVAAALIVLLPGPDTMVVLRSLVRGGRSGALRTVAGILTGLVLWIMAASLGLSAVLRASHAGYTALRLVGAAYLVWLGVQSLLQRNGDPSVDIGGGRRALLGHGFGAGFATDILNPKVGVFFVTFLPGFVPHGQPVATATLVFGVIFLIETVVYFALLLTLATRITRWLGTATIRRRLDRGTGVVLIGLGARLALEP